MCVCDAGGLGMLWFIVWMLLTADEPLRDGGMNADERSYITACLTSNSHVQLTLISLSLSVCLSVCVCVGRQGSFSLGRQPV